MIFSEMDEELPLEQAMHYTATKALGRQGRPRCAKKIEPDERVHSAGVSNV